MSNALEWTQADIDLLKAAVRRGVRVVQFADRRVEYHSLAEMRALLASMAQDVDAAAGKPSYRLMGHSKGT